MTSKDVVDHMTVVTPDGAGAVVSYDRGTVGVEFADGQVRHYDVSVLMTSSMGC